MGDLILKRILKNEKGYLLIESLMGLSIVSVLILVLYPILVNWLLLVETEKEQVEMTRVLYESSFNWPNKSEITRYTIRQDKQSLILLDQKNKVGVYIYETQFEK